MHVLSRRRWPPARARRRPGDVTRAPSSLRVEHTRIRTAREVRERAGPRRARRSRGTLERATVDDRLNEEEDENENDDENDE